MKKFLPKKRWWVRRWIVWTPLEEPSMAFTRSYYTKMGMRFGRWMDDCVGESSVFRTITQTTNYDPEKVNGG